MWGSIFWIVLVIASMFFMLLFDVFDGDFMFKLLEFSEYRSGLGGVFILDVLVWEGFGGKNFYVEFLSVVFFTVVSCFIIIWIRLNLDAFVLFKFN